jgi:hypothetical protein
MLFSPVVVVLLITTVVGVFSDHTQPAVWSQHLRVYPVAVRAGEE